MQLVIHRDHLELVPESPIERAYIEDTLGLRRGGDSIALVRRDQGAKRGEARVWLEAGREVRS